MLSRRTHLKHLLLTGFGAALLSSPITQSQPSLRLPSISHESEKYWQLIQQQFPLDGKRIYMNNATLGPSPYPVLQTVQQALFALNSTTKNEGLYPIREVLARFLNVAASEIAITHNTTEGINIVAQGLPLKKGDEVIMTTHEHAGNALPWLNRMRLTGITIKTFVPQNNASDNLNAMNDLINARTKVLAIPHITCTTGHVLPVKAMTKLAHDKGVWTFIDGAHVPGSTVLDIADIGCDFYASCCHKWMLGPKGTGFVYIKEALQDTVQAHWIGRAGEGSWDLNTPVPMFSGYKDSAARYDFGTQNGALLKGIAASVDFLEQIGMEQIENRTRHLATYLFKKLQIIEAEEGSIELLSPAEAISRGPMVSFRVKNRDFKEFWQAVYDKKYRIRMVPEAGLNAQRVSTHIYNDFEQIDGLVAAIQEILKK